MNDAFDPFLGTSGPRDADIMIVGEAYGATEEQKGLPFVGASGKELTKILAESGIDRSKCFLTNVVNLRPYQNKMTNFCFSNAEAKELGEERERGLYPKPVLLAGRENLLEQIKTVNPRVIIAFGNYALWALTSDCFSTRSEKGYRIPAGIVSWHGSQLYSVTGHPLVPTFHPAAVMRKWDWRYYVLQDLRTRVPLAGTPKFSEPDWDFTIRPTFEQVAGTIKRLLTQADKFPFVLAVDIETRAFNIACLGFAWSKLEALCIPFQCDEDVNGYWTLDEEFRIHQLLRKLFAHPGVMIVGQNFLYDLQYIYHTLFIKPKVAGDTMVAYHVCYPGTSKGLDQLSSLFCNYHRYWKDEGKVWAKDVDEDTWWTYNCKDCVATFEIWDEVSARILELGMLEQLAFQLRQIPMLLDMMIRGVKIDTTRRANTTFELTTAIEEREIWLENSLYPHTYPSKPKAAKWHASPTQLATIFYDVFGLRPIKNRKTGAVTTDDEALKKIAMMEPLLRPICRVLAELRSLRVFLKTFALAKLDPDKRMRCSWNLAGPETFRYSSSENAFGSGTNMQNIPEGTEDED